MDEWMKYLITGGGSLGAGAVVGLILGFVIRWRKQTTSDYQLLFQQAFQRITTLEENGERLRADHLKCMEDHAAANAELTLMKTMTTRMHEDNLGVFRDILTEMKEDRAVTSKRQGEIIDHLADVWGVLKEQKGKM